MSLAADTSPLASRETGPALAAEIDTKRSEARTVFSVDQVAVMPTAELSALQRLLGHGEELGVWCTPPEWFTPGSLDGRARIDLRARIAHFLQPEVRGTLNSDLLEKTAILLSRYLVLLSIGPSGLGRATSRSLRPTAILSVAYSYGPSLFAVALTRRLNVEDTTAQESSDRMSLLSLVRLRDLEELTVSTAKLARRECRRMRVLSELGLWPDAPSIEGPTLVEAMKGPKQKSTPTTSPGGHLPLPDDYVSMLGTRTFWVIHDLGPNLLHLAAKMDDVWKATASTELAPVTIRDHRREAVKDLLATHVWTTSDGQPFDTPPFPLSLAGRRGFIAQDSIAEEVEPEDDPETDESDTQTDLEQLEVRWPPQNYTDLVHLFGTLQAAHLVVALLSNGPRHSEVLSLPLDCVVYARDGRPYANGKTFKLVEWNGGAQRDWLLPELGMEAIEQQTRLVGLCESVGFLSPSETARMTPASKDLWRRFSANQAQCNPKKTLSDVNRVLVRYARTLGLDINPGGQRIRSHRFRKTLARLVALALTQAPRLLMDVFGHKSLEMTLYYILTDKELRAEIETVSRELRVMRAKEVVEDMVAADIAATSGDGVEYGGYGGLAAISIHTAVVAKTQEVHRTGAIWGARDSIELAELLTLQGTSWLQVRKGVLCTKLPGEAGPCNRSKGRPEPSKCGSKCEHRLEDGFLRDDVDASLAAAVSGYEAASEADDVMTAALWAGQIRALLPRFHSVKQKWSTHPTVRLLVSVEALS